MTAKKKAMRESQSARFIEAAKKAGADESGKKFEKAFKKIVRKRPHNPTKEQS
jgi:hypothetical protein